MVTKFVVISCRRRILVMASWVHVRKINKFKFKKKHQRKFTGDPIAPETIGRPRRGMNHRWRPAARGTTTTKVVPVAAFMMKKMMKLSRVHSGPIKEEHPTHTRFLYDDNSAWQIAGKPSISSEIFIKSTCYVTIRKFRTFKVVAVYIEPNWFLNSLIWWYNYRINLYRSVIFLPCKQPPNCFDYDLDVI